MKITLLTYGTRGDVEPFLALADGLIRSGWDVHLAAPAAYRHLLTNPQVVFTGLPGDPANMVRKLEHVSARDIVKTVKGMIGFVLPIAADVYTQARSACRDADAIVHSFLFTIAGYEFARERRIPSLSAQFFPIFAPTRAFPALNMPDLPLGCCRRLTHSAFSEIFWQGSRFAYRKLLQSNPQLPPLSGWPFRRGNPVSPPVLFAFSPQVVPRAADWEPDIHLTGYWINEEPAAWQPPGNLEHFLDEGTPPICLGMGSSGAKSAARLVSAFINVCLQTGQRGILTGRKPAAQLPDSILYLEDAPYERLFHRCAVVVHHGGAGTTAAGLRSGVPNIVSPITSDQPFWASRVYSLGIGPKPVPARKITAGKLAAALDQALNDPEIRKRAAAFGKSLRSEDGVRRAVDWIESTVLHSEC